MNKKLVFNLIGSVLLMAGALMLLSLIVSLIYAGDDTLPILYTMLITLAIGFALSRIKPRDEKLRAREGFAVVALSWLIVSILGGLPFYISGYIPSFVDCVFESVSGFTTTGATILTDIEALPKGLLFWRSFTHWAGGMGVLVLSLAILPRMGSRSIHLLRAESPGPSTDKLVPRVGESAKILYKIYIGLTVIMVVTLLICGQSLYDSLLDTFGAAGTGGFSPYNASIAHYQKPAVEIVIAVFMALFGINFAMYYALLSGNFKDILKNGELRLYLCMMLASTLLIAWNTLPLMGGRIGEALRSAFFQVSSVMTTTGYSTHDFALWPQLSQAIIVILMLIGCCAGSTGGGIKVVRIQLLIKSMSRDIRRSVHPQGVRAIKLNGRAVDEQIISATQVFFFTYIAIIAATTLIVSFDGFGFDTSLTSVIATISNIGPGLGLVGPVGNYSMFSTVSKIALSMCMLIGRLEIFPMLMLFTPSAWRR